MVTPVRNICSVSGSYSSFVFVMPIVALRRLSLSPVWHTFSVYLWFSLHHGYQMEYVHTGVSAEKHTTRDMQERNTWKFFLFEE